MGDRYNSLGRNTTLKNPDSKKELFPDKVPSLPDFENWIITKNDNGIIKVATCEEDESQMYEKTRDWIVYAGEVVEDEKIKVEENDLQDNNLKKNAVFLIRDLLNAKNVNGQFICKNIRFNSVYICGIVTEKNFNEKNYYFQVDDGTSSIRCIISTEYLQDLKTSYFDVNSSRQMFLGKKENESIFSKAARITMSSIEYLQKSLPSWDDVRLGDVVKIIGNFREYNNYRYVFIMKITKEPSESLALNSYLEHIIDLYSNVYENDEDKNNKE